MRVILALDRGLLYFFMLVCGVVMLPSHLSNLICLKSRMVPPACLEIIRSICLLRNFGQLDISGLEDFSNFARLPHLFPLFGQSVCSRNSIYS